jgi:hypothetical protein
MKRYSQKVAAVEVALCTSLLEGDRQQLLHHGRQEDPAIGGAEPRCASSRHMMAPHVPLLPGALTRGDP